MKHTWLLVLALAAVAVAVEVTVPTSKGPVTLEIHEATISQVVPAPGPDLEPVLESPWPDTPGCWIYPGNEYAAALTDMGIGWIQYWSIQYNPETKPAPADSMPYMSEMHPDQLSGNWPIRALVSDGVTIDDPNHSRAKYFPTGNDLGIAGSADNDGWYKAAGTTPAGDFLTVSVTPPLPNPNDATGNFGWFNRNFDRVDGPRGDDCKAWLRAHAQRPGCLGINLSCEVARGGGTRDVIAFIRANLPDMKIFTGTFGWPAHEEPDLYAYDGLVGFLNCTRYGRLPEDVYWCEAIANHYGKPWCMSVQPVNAEAGMSLANPEWFQQGMDIACKRAYGMCLWKVEGLAAVQAGDLACVNPERLPAILATIKNARIKRERRVLKTVRFSGNWNEDRLVARVVGRAGYAPKASDTEGFSLAGLTLTPAEEGAFKAFGAGNSPDAQAAWVLIEQGLVERLKGR